MDYILDRLAVGAWEEALAPPPQITALLGVAEEKDLRTGLLYHKVPIADMRPIPPPQLAEAVAWLRDHIAGHRILLFCNAGVGRSPSVAVAFLCLERGLGFGEAVEFVARRHPGMSTLPMLIRTIEEVREMGR